MQNRQPPLLTTLAVCALAGGAALAANGAGAADHLDAPGVAADGRTDINDLYAFQSPQDPDNTVLIMTVNPLSGIVSGDSFHPEAEYTFHIDQDGDATADREVTVKFSDVSRTGQRYVVKLDGPAVANGRTGSTTPLRRIGGSVTAGTFEDPFFFDLNGFRDGLNFTGADAFAGADVSAIAIELPSSWVGGNVGIWATTSVDGRQIDRMGRPAINTVLIPSDRKDEFNASQPSNDRAAFGDDVRAAITGLSGGDAAFAAAVTDVLLPDVLTFDTQSSAGFLNGRQLADDVIDAELGLLTKGAVTGDGVNANDVPFLDQFPYLAPANG